MMKMITGTMSNSSLGFIRSTHVMKIALIEELIFNLSFSVCRCEV
ncbi:hypothetical protein [Borrelia turicatae]|nr:hypothetical protein [Borrelia turicatae]